MTSLDSVHADVNTWNGHKNSSGDTVQDGLSLLHIDNQIEILSHMHAALWLHCKDNGLTTTDAHRNMMKQGRSMTTQGQMKVLPRKPFYV